MTPEARLRRRIRTPVLAVTALAWACLVLTAPWGAAGGHATPSAALAARLQSHVHPASVAVPPADAARVALPPHATHPGTTGHLWAGTLMLAAMMSPLLIPALRHVSARSLPGRRLRAIALVTASCAAVWAAGYLVLVAAAGRLLALPGPPAIGLASGAVCVLAWQASPLKQHCLNRHHSHPPLAAFGWAAWLGALRFGTRHAAWCLASCSGLMLLPLLVPGWHLGAMILVSLWMWAEQLEPPAAAGWRLRVPRRAARIVVGQARLVLHRTPVQAALRT